MFREIKKVGAVGAPDCKLISRFGNIVIQTDICKIICCTNHSNAKTVQYTKHLIFFTI